MNAPPLPALAGIAGIARRLVLDGALSEIDAHRAFVESAKARQPLLRWLLERRLVSTAAVAAANSAEFGIPLLDIGAFDLTQIPLKVVDDELIRRHSVLPLYKRGGRLFLAIADPTNAHVIEEVQFVTGIVVDPVLVDEDALRRAIDRALSMAEALDTGGDDEELSVLESEPGDDEQDEADGIGGKEDDAPVVKFINKMLLDAIKRGASDLHFEPYENDFRVRFRMDGVLKTVSRAPVGLGPRLTSRIKVMAQLDIAEKRLPQDGRIKLNLSKTQQMDFRVSTCPTLFGEKAVLRILDGSAAKMGIDKLGYEDHQKQLFLNALAKPYGMILVTGPTGSGKTVSLYTGLNILNTDERNISTAEDPVEIRMPGINQVQMNVKKGMTFAAALRSFLRQDPDVIMVGEIRDLETAEIAIKAAQTGHLVLSTLHTNDAPQTVARLMNMGVAPYNITSSVTLIIAQRLARRLHDCKKKVHIPEAALVAEGFKPEECAGGLDLYEPVGCEDCNGGYKGRVGIYQVMPMSEEIQKTILEGGSALDIARICAREGIGDLRRSAINKVKSGQIGLAEMNRVTKD
ncbi:type IV-A pilus assembly ATPase PilB [Silanimonas sp.]|uniref:type IV-A pilus assembly ATPase PilB n=1 Tax=Silanimonas sp. TaxID=1929290 RepID=UPI001BB91BAF|nr:type IV-A pilus assembly ATPase PilB [Silanimonas sp.]MBS3895229.1 type IV-A pilus assembly ATPase PilB [Silanimonas sp.]MBS3924913.1 type IV-A pilus assembly ATPase PilB [Xanthomonadaceae bacterium]